MRGMRKWLWEVFAVVVVGYCLYFSPIFVLWTAVVVFVGGGILLTVVAYAAARFSMPRPASSYLPKEMRQESRPKRDSR